MTEAVTPPLQIKKGVAHWLHRAFELALAAKGAVAMTEVLAGLGLFLPLPLLLRQKIEWLTHYNVVQTPADPMAQVVQHAAETLSLADQYFFGYYLIAHGGLKLILILLLARRIRWAFPVAIVALGGFIVYQAYHWTQTGSSALLVMSALDSLTVFLVWREFLTLAPTSPPA